MVTALQRQLQLQQDHASLDTARVTLASSRNTQPTQGTHLQLPCIQFLLNYCIFGSMWIFCPDPVESSDPRHPHCRRPTRTPKTAPTPKTHHAYLTREKPGFGYAVRVVRRKELDRLDYSVPAHVVSHSQHRAHHRLFSHDIDR